MKLIRFFFWQVICCLVLFCGTVYAEDLNTSKNKTIGPWPYITLLGGSVGDVISTKWALDQGAKEGNFIVYGSHPNMKRLLGTKAIASVIPIVFMRLLDKQGKNKTAKIIGYTLGGISGGISGWNISQGIKSKK